MYNSSYAVFHLHFISLPLKFFTATAHPYYPERSQKTVAPLQTPFHVLYERTLQHRSQWMPAGKLDQL